MKKMDREIWLAVVPIILMWAFVVFAFARWCCESVQ